MNGPGTSFIVPYGCGWSARQIEHFLRKRGIKTWGLMVVGDEIIFEVERRKGKFAALLLGREGIPFSAGPV